MVRFVRVYSVSLDLQNCNDNKQKTFVPLITIISFNYFSNLSGGTARVSVKIYGCRRGGGGRQGRYYGLLLSEPVSGLAIANQ